jgi:hypothetical protein
MEFFFKGLLEKNGGTTRLSADWKLLYDNSVNTAIFALILSVIFAVLAIRSSKKKDTSAKKFYAVMTVASLAVAGIAYFASKNLIA